MIQPCYEIISQDTLVYPQKNMFIKSLRKCAVTSGSVTVTWRP